MHTPRKRKRSYLKTVSFLLLFSVTLFTVTVTCFSLRFLSGDRFSGARLVSVPDLVGRSLGHTLFESAEEAALCQITVRERSDRAPRGTVLSQDPPRGSIRKAIPGKRYVTLTLTVSKGPALTVTPSVVGLSEEQAREQLLSAGLTPDLHLEYSSRPRGEVLSTTPAADTPIEQYGRVTLTVSKGPRFPRVAVPSVIGLSEVEARSLLGAHGLSVGRILATPSSMASGRIACQSVNAGHMLPIGSSVDLSVTVPLPEAPPRTPPPQAEDSSSSPFSPEAVIDRILGPILRESPSEFARKDSFYEATDPAGKDP